MVLKTHNFFLGGGGTHLYSLASFVRPGSANNKILVNSYSELKVMGQCARVKQGAVKPATKTKQKLILPVIDRAAHVAVPNLEKKSFTSCDLTLTFFKELDLV